MTDSEKIMAAGCAAGAAAAVLPAAYGFIKARAKKPICDADLLRAENGGFILKGYIQKIYNLIIHDSTGFCKIRQENFR